VTSSWFLIPQLLTVNQLGTGSLGGHGFLKVQVHKPNARESPLCKQEWLQAMFIYHQSDIPFTQFKNCGYSKKFKCGC